MTANEDSMDSAIDRIMQTYDLLVNQHRRRQRRGPRQGDGICRQTVRGRREGHPSAHGVRADLFARTRWQQRSGEGGVYGAVKVRARPPRSATSVVLAKAGTHNHRGYDLRESLPRVATPSASLPTVSMGPRFREDDGGVFVAHLAKISRIQISNSQALSFSRRRASWAFSFSPLFEGRRSAERRTLVVTNAPSRTLGTEAHGNVFDVLLRRLTSGVRRELRRLAIQAGFRPPSPVPVQPLKAEPRSGPGRLPKAPRVRACEAQPQAPHRPSGCPSGQLSLCPTSERLMKRPSLDRTRSG